MILTDPKYERIGLEAQHIKERPFRVLQVESPVNLDIRSHVGQFPEGLSETYGHRARPRPTNLFHSLFRVFVEARALIKDRIEKVIPFI